MDIERIKMDAPLYGPQACDLIVSLCNEVKRLTALNEYENSAFNEVFAAEQKARITAEEDVRRLREENEDICTTMAEVAAVLQKRAEAAEAKLKRAEEDVRRLRGEINKWRETVGDWKLEERTARRRAEAAENLNLMLQSQINEQEKMFRAAEAKCAELVDYDPLGLVARAEAAEARLNSKQQRVEELAGQLSDEMDLNSELTATIEKLEAKWRDYESAMVHWRESASFTADKLEKANKRSQFWKDNSDAAIADAQKAEAKLKRAEEVIEAVKTWNNGVCEVADCLTLVAALQRYEEDV